MITYPCDLLTLDTPATHFMEGWEGPGMDVYALSLMDDDGVILRREIGTNLECVARAMTLASQGVKRVDEYGWNALCEAAWRRKPQTSA